MRNFVQFLRIGSLRTDYNHKLGGFSRRISKDISYQRTFCQTKLHYYLNWLTQWYVFFPADIGAAVESEQITQYLRQLSEGSGSFQALWPLKYLKRTKLLMARLNYGCGLRLRKFLNLRIKDLNIKRSRQTIRSWKGDKDREILLPEKLIVDLNSHIRMVWSLFNQDREKNVPVCSQVSYA